MARLEILIFQDDLLPEKYVLPPLYKQHICIFLQHFENWKKSLVICEFSND